jgi:hypothetical protein
MRCISADMRIRSSASLIVCASSIALASATPARAQTTAQVPQGSPDPDDDDTAQTIPAAPPVDPSAALGPVSRPYTIEDWSAGQPIPSGYRPSTHIRKVLVITGAVLFGAAYLWSATYAMLPGLVGGEGSSQAPYLFVPVVGPFLQMGKSGNTTAGNCWLALDATAQVGGVAMFVVGLAVPKTVLVRDDYGSRRGFELALSPMLGPGLGGMGAMGTF